MRASKTPSSGSDRSRKRRTGLLKRIKRGLNRRDRGLMLFVIGVTAFFGAGVVDMWTDVIPLRPYSGIFVAGFALKKRRAWSISTLTTFEKEKEDSFAGI